MNRTKRKATITASQAAVLLTAGSTGSAIVYIPSMLADIAGNTVWLSLGAAYGFGLLLLAAILVLYRSHGGRDLIGCSRAMLGRWPTVAVAIIPAAMLLFAIPAITAGIGDFVTSTMMSDTPPYVFNALNMFVAALTVKAGVEIIARMFVLLLAILFGFTIIVILLALPLYDPQNLFPLFPKGGLSVVHGAIVVGGFPFGETLFFSMILPYVKRTEGDGLTSKLYAAMSLTGLMLLLSTLGAILAFGPAAGYFQYPLFSLASEIDLADVIQRVESIIGIALILGSYMKSTLYLLILNNIIAQAADLRDDKLLVYPTALLCTLLSLTLFRDPADFNEQVYVIWPIIVLLAGGALVAFLLLLTRFTAHRSRAGKGRDAA